MTTSTNTPTTQTITPLNDARWTILARVLSPIAHGDPEIEVYPMNVAAFRRRAHLVTPDEERQRTAQEQSERLTQQRLEETLARFPIPLAAYPYLEPLTAPQFLAVALVCEFTQMYGAGEGEGIFTGFERYARLSARMRQCARRAESLYGFWSDLCENMQVGGKGGRGTALFALLALPGPIGYYIIRALGAETETTVALARLWNEEAKLMNESYAASVGVVPSATETRLMAYRVDDLPKHTPSLIRSIPAISGNAIRHNLVREPGLLHLMDRLGIGLEELPPAVGFLLANGGALRKRSKAPDNAYQMGWQVYRAYPLLELIGASADAFILPPSALAVSVYLVCTENVDALAPLGISPDQPAEALVDREVLARHAQRWGEGSMPHGFETLIEGAQIVCQFSLTPYASERATGALAAALTWAQQQPSVGGRGAGGYGALQFDLPTDDRFLRARDAYEAELVVRRDELRAGLLDGTFTTGFPVCLLEGATGTSEAAADGASKRRGRPTTAARATVEEGDA